MAQNAAQSSGSQSSPTAAAPAQGAHVDENTKLLEQIASLVQSVKALAERSDSSASGSQAPPTSTDDQIFQEQVGFAYSVLGSMLGRGKSFDAQVVIVPVKRESKSLVFGDLRGATAARVRARVKGVDEVAALSDLVSGKPVQLAFEDSQAIDGIEILDAPDGAVVALGRLE